MVKGKNILLILPILAIFLMSIADAIIFSDPVETQFTITPECSVDSDCRNDYYESEEYYCKEGAVYYRREFHYQGCIEGSCYEITTFQERLIKVCEYGCEDGECLPPQLECEIDADCQADYYSENYCEDNSVYRDFHDFSCQEEECVEDIIPELVEECSYGCEDRKCVEEEKKERKYEGGRYKEIDYCGDMICDKLIGEDELTCKIDCEPKQKVYLNGKSGLNIQDADVSEDLDRKSVKDNNSSFLIPLLLLILVVVLIIIIIAAVIR